MASMLPSPAISVVGRHNSGKTTLVERLIAKLSSDGFDVGSVKHHGHVGFDIDVPGKDSYRHRQAGATETYIVAPGKMAMVKSIPGDMECSDIVARMPGHDIVIVEGYRLSGLPSIEIMRSGNDRDQLVAQAFYDASVSGVSLACDVLQLMRQKGKACFTNEASVQDDLLQKMPGAQTVAIVSDIPLARKAAENYGIPCFDVDDIQGVSEFIVSGYARPRLTVAIQAGGESKRMGQSKATVQFAGRPLITRVVGRVLPVADEVIITTNEAENLQFLFDEFPNANIRLVADACEQRGALPGLFTAFEAAAYPLVAVVACDMVNASSNLIAFEYSKMKSAEYQVCIPRNSHGREPFHAMYRRDACLKAARRCLDAGQLRAQSILVDLEVIDISQSEVLQAVPGGGCFTNLNTPEELAKAEMALDRVLGNQA